jgi:hypothetical protein
MSRRPKVRLEGLEAFERDVKLRLPFRFGASTLRWARQAVIRVTLALDDGRCGTGVAAETLGGKWFDKNPALSDEQNRQQLRQALELAARLYRAQGWRTPFALYAGTYEEQLALGAELGLLPLVACFGPALIDRAILDALGRATRQSFPEMMATNAAGIEVPGQLTPDLVGFDIPGFLARLRPRRGIAVRHTVGLLDPIGAGDVAAADRVNDGLPQTLEEVVRVYANRHFKLKVGGDVSADLARLRSIAAVLDREAGDYRATLDGNEQFDSLEGIDELMCRMAETPALAKLWRATLFIEQPITRANWLTVSVAALARKKPLIIDESDGELAAFPTALALGYSGVSSKSCKGLYKSILNAARIARLDEGQGAGRVILSGEDLTTLAGVSVQQDLALLSLLGLTHAERNGHHFVDGMSFAGDGEQARFAGAHQDLYRQSSGTVRLAINRGDLRLGSLACPGFAVAANMDFSAMQPMPAAPKEPILSWRPARVRDPPINGAAGAASSCLDSDPASGP